MQCPPTPQPGAWGMNPNGLVAAPSSTWATSMPSLANDIASSLTNAMFMSRKEFSTIFTASASCMVSIARTGASMSNGSGDYVIAFSSAPSVRRRQGEPVHQAPMLDNGEMDDLFVGVAEATKEAIDNSLFKAEGMRGDRGAVPALPIDQVLRLLRD